MEEFPSGQRGQTVNLLRFASVVRIHPPPPTRRKLHIACDEFFCKKLIAHSFRCSSLPKCDPLRWARIWDACGDFFCCLPSQSASLTAPPQGEPSCSPLSLRGGRSPTRQSVSFVPLASPLGGGAQCAHWAERAVLPTSVPSIAYLSFSVNRCFCAHFTFILWETAFFGGYFLRIFVLLKYHPPGHTPRCGTFPYTFL